MWLSENERAKFWLSVATELQNRSVRDILIACVDGLKGFPDAIPTVCPLVQIQICIVTLCALERLQRRYIRFEKDLSVPTNQS